MNKNKQAIRWEKAEVLFNEKNDCPFTLARVKGWKRAAFVRWDFMGHWSLDSDPADSNWKDKVVVTHWLRRPKTEDDKLFTDKNVTKVYKVVECRGTHLLSTYAPPAFKVEYIVGETVLPKKGTKLFCFETLEDARQYASYCNEGIGLHEVYEAEATNAHRNGWFRYKIFDLDKLIERFQQDESSPEYYKSKNYQSSMVCDSLKLIKKV